MMVMAYWNSELLKAVDTTECLQDVTSVGDYVCLFVRLGSLNVCKALSQLNVTGRNFSWCFR